MELEIGKEYTSIHDAYIDIKYKIVDNQLFINDSNGWIKCRTILNPNGEYFKEVKEKKENYAL